MSDETAAQTKTGAAPVDNIPTSTAVVSERIAAQLMEGKLDGIEVAPAQPEPATPAAEAQQPATPETKPETKPAEAAKPEAAKPETPTEPPAPADPFAAIQLPDVPHPFDDPQDPRIDDVTDARQTKIRERFDGMREKLRAARENGQFGSLVLDSAAQGGLDPAHVASLVTLTAKANRGDQAAKAELAQVMQQLGVIQPPAPPAPAPRPDLDTVSEAVYREMFKADVEGLNITEDRARELAKKIARDRLERLPTAPPPPPAHSQPVHVPPSQPAHPVAPDPVTQAALGELERLDGQYAAAFRTAGVDFAPIRDEAQRRIAARVRSSGPIPPIRWAYEFAQVVRTIQTEKAKTQTTQTKPTIKPGAEQTLRPSSGAAKGGGADWRQQLVDQMMSGALPS